MTGELPTYEYTSGAIDADLADVLDILHGSESST